MGLLGRAYMEGKMGFEKDTASGLALLEKAANGGIRLRPSIWGTFMQRGRGWSGIWSVP